VGTSLLYSSCRVCHCKHFGCVIFEFNDKLLDTKNDSERRRCVSLGLAQWRRTRMATVVRLFLISIRWTISDLKNKKCLYT